MEKNSRYILKIHFIKPLYCTHPLLNSLLACLTKLRFTNSFLIYCEYYKLLCFLFIYFEIICLINLTYINFIDLLTQYRNIAKRYIKFKVKIKLQKYWFSIARTICTRIAKRLSRSFTVTCSIHTITRLVDWRNRMTLQMFVNTQTRWFSLLLKHSAPNTSNFQISNQWQHFWMMDFQEMHVIDENGPMVSPWWPLALYEWISVWWCLITRLVMLLS